MQVRLLQQHAESQRARPDSLDGASTDARSLASQLKQKLPEAASTDELAVEVEITFRDSSTNEVTSLKGQADKLRDHLDKLEQVLEQKQQEASNLEDQWDQFNTKLESCKQFIESCSEKLKRLRPQTGSPEAVAAVVKELEELQQTLTREQGAQEATQQLGRSLIEADASCFPRVQGPLGSLASDWESLSSETTRTHRLLTCTHTLWLDCRRLESEIDKVLDGVEAALRDATTPQDGDSLTAMAQKLGVHQEEVRSHQPVLDSYRRKTQELVEKTEALEGLSVAGAQLKKDLESREKRWTETTEKLQTRVHQLDNDLALWRQVETAREEVEAWLEDICEAMRNALQHLSQGDQARAVLDRYQTEVETQQNLFRQFVEQLETLGMSATLEAVQSETQSRFEEAGDLVEQLRTLLGHVEQQEEDVRSEMQRFSDWLRQQKDALSRCDNTAGSDDILLQRLDDCRKLEEALNSNVGLMVVEDKLSQLTKSQPDLEVRHLQRELEKLKTRLEATKSQAARAAAALLSVLERHHQGALTELQHWLSTANDKLAWCSGGTDGSANGDRFGLEARLVTLQELESTLEQGEKRNDQYRNAASLLSQACPPERVAPLQDECSRMASEWCAFTSALAQTRESLQRGLGQWQHLEGLLESLSDWLRDAESRAKSEAARQVDLPLVSEQLANLKALLREVQSHKDGLQQLQTTAASVTAQVPETQVPGQVSQLSARVLHLDSVLQRPERRPSDVFEKKSSSMSQL
ncbi:nesprin-1 [Ixodes scapularis]|uniref:nesprin-1 n=1 Tax=Ixodes scapularis TaxID=6945 RepID=UPI001C389EB3|nr:nesprin-1 [Ixodes scapularis]